MFRYAGKREKSCVRARYWIMHRQLIIWILILDVGDEYPFGPVPSLKILTRQSHKFLARVLLYKRNILFGNVSDGSIFSPRDV